MQGRWLGVLIQAALAAGIVVAIVAVKSAADESAAQTRRLAGSVEELTARQDRIESALASLRQKAESRAAAVLPSNETAPLAGPAGEGVERRLAELEAQLASLRDREKAAPNAAAGSGREVGGVDLSRMGAEELRELAARHSGLASDQATQQVDTLVKAYTELLERFPEDARREVTLNSLVGTLLRAHRYDSAREAAVSWGKKLALPEWKVQKFLSDNAMAQRDLAKARELSESVARAPEVSREAKAGAEFTIAYSWYLERNFDKAEPLLRNLVSDYGSPEDPRLTHVVQGAKNVLTTLAAERNR